MIRREGLTWLLSFTPAKGGSAPPPPDPVATANAQTQSNQSTAAYNAAINRGNTYTPYGSSTYTTRTDPTTGAPVYDQTIDLSPDARALVDQQMAQDRALGNTAQNMLTSVDAAYRNPMDTSGLPARQSTLQDTGPGIQGTVSTDGLPALLGEKDLLGARQQLQDALYARNTALLDPQWQQREEQMRTRLANQGITQNSEAWNNAMDEANRARSFDYARAREGAIVGGLGEMTGLSDMARGNRGQLFGERTAQGAFQNSAQAQAMAEALTRLGVNNDARAQGLQEMTALRNQPLNEFNALRSASQVESPQFQGPGSVSSNATDVAGIIGNNYQQRLNIWNAQQQASNGLLSGLMGLGGTLGGAAIMASDRRLKTAVKRVGLIKPGVGLYEYEYKGDPLREKQVGVMAQEVERDNPRAVVTMDNGYKAVDYGAVLADALQEVA